ncbi:TIGR03936 family radical SAM-associated protein [Serpentinicella sp. ANB-PHB4]|uniref:TIGR03936 family radical SAM-associated protein n=1 Tax=Serpentinicella sp. ANB-PHB4 TaxID=3074076 RepID=UPI00285854F2|nr:TIGR03936 family radical SAM-associated protein [Serpentinicella sp. ANB-PHB4]MDR5657897.1 TIGR03936 family radical SAM-associated protein [Serpentinicella sp. ANB-PHB4]
MFKIRSKFYKKDDMVFISHLDLLRVFERAMRRAQIPIAYSQGFNPHPIMAFSSALSLGVSSDSEYVDITLLESLQEEDFTKKLNEVLPPGLKIIFSRSVGIKEKALMAEVCSSIYFTRFLLTEKYSEDNFSKNLKEFMSLDEIIIKKEKKKRKGRKKISIVKEIDLRKLVFDMELSKLESNEVILKLVLSAGEKGNVKPETVINELINRFEMPIELKSLRIHRGALLNEEGQELMQP